MWHLKASSYVNVSEKAECEGSNEVIGLNPVQA